MDAITTLKNDHKTVEQLFKRFEKAGERAHVEKREIVDRIIEELSIHAAIEEQAFYPVVRETVPDTDDLVLEGLEEHHIVKWVLSELQTMTSEDERFDAKVTVLIENVRHHVKEEENDFFPKVRDELGRGALNDLGEAMAVIRKTAPTHPHPRSPDSPPANLVVGAASGVADRIGDTVSGLAQGSVSAAGDIIATVMRRKKPRVSPTGSKVARETAGKVRSEVSAVAEDLIRGTSERQRAARNTASGPLKNGTGTNRTNGRSASPTRSAAKKTAKAVKARTTSTATSARTATKKAAGNAKRAGKSTTTAKRTARAASSKAKSAPARTARAASKSAKSTKARAKSTKATPKG